LGRNGLQRYNIVLGRPLAGEEKAAADMAAIIVKPPSLCRWKPRTVD
jgi:hypothetical protein